MSIAVTLCILLTSFQTADAAAQDKPAFSGDWILVTPSEPPAGAARTLTVAHDAASIRITRVSSTGSASAAYTLDPPIASGRVEGTAGGSGTRHTMQVRWVGSSLRFDDSSCRPQQGGTETCASEAWSLGKTGLLSIERTTHGPGLRVSKATFIYRKP